MTGRWTQEEDKALLDMGAKGISPSVMSVRLGRETASVVRHIRTLKERTERQSNGYARGPMSDEQKEAIRQGQRAARQRRENMAK